MDVYKFWLEIDEKINDLAKRGQCRILWHDSVITDATGWVHRGSKQIVAADDMQTAMNIETLLHNITLEKHNLIIDKKTGAMKPFNLNIKIFHGSGDIKMHAIRIPISFRGLTRNDIREYLHGWYMSVAKNDIMDMRQFAYQINMSDDELNEKIRAITSEQERCFLDDWNGIAEQLDDVSYYKITRYDEYSVSRRVNFYDPSADRRIQTPIGDVLIVAGSEIGSVISEIRKGRRDSIHQSADVRSKFLFVKKIE